MDNMLLLAYLMELFPSEIRYLFHNFTHVYSIYILYICLYTVVPKNGNFRVCVLMKLMFISSNLGFKKFHVQLCVKNTEIIFILQEICFKNKKTCFIAW